MPTVTINEARASLPELIDQARAGNKVIITRQGFPLADIIPHQPEPKEVLPIDVEAFAKELGEYLKVPRPIERGISDPGWADRLITQIRADRDSD